MWMVKQVVYGMDGEQWSESADHVQYFTEEAAQTRADKLSEMYPVEFFYVERVEWYD